MAVRNFKIVSTGAYRPGNEVTSLELDERLGHRPGWVENKSGVKSRRYASADESSASMGAAAARHAIANAGWSKVTDGDIDCIISASGTVQQAIPCTAVFIQRALGLAKFNIPCFDVNSTCLSFLTALDTATALLAVGRYRRILIVSSDLPSLGLDWRHMESSLIFGDGAAAMIIEASSAGYAGSTTVLASHMETYSDAAEVCQVRAGGTALHPTRAGGDLREASLFEMDGKAAFKVSAEHIKDFMKTLFEGTDLSLKDVDVVVPHQASNLGMHHMRKRLGIAEEKFVDIYADHGNQVAASMPTAFHHARASGMIKLGSTVLVLGTGAGISISAMLLRFAS